MDIQPRTIWGEDPAARDAWKAGFDDGSTSGLMCRRCGALVPRRPDATDLHRGWHEKVDRARA